MAAKQLNLPMMTGVARWLAETQFHENLMNALNGWNRLATHAIQLL